MQKIDKGKATSNDLFSVVDELGDKSGSINKDEFELLTKRLGLKLSEHRIYEIFSSVK